MQRLVPLVLVAAACGGHASSPKPMDKTTMMDTMMDHNMAMAADPASTFGPMQEGADWATYTKVSSSPFRSPTHGGRDVEVWVNAVGLAAYEHDDAALPVGTVIVKTSIEHGEGGVPIPGPLFVMEKKPAGFAPEHDDWYFAIRWEAPSPTWAAKLGGPIYWRTPSPKAAYCSECHDGYDRGLGGVPDGHRAW